jgi:sugar fermentation stimulation protein A
METANTQTETGIIKWPELFKGTLIKRYKRFLADIRLESGETITAHCANSGTMKECCEPGRPVWLSYHDNPKRKLKYSWEFIDMGNSLVGVNTNIPNRLVKTSIECGKVEELSGYDTVTAEIKVGKNSRLDLFLSGNGKKNCYVEIKNCTLVTNGFAQFPDAVTTRGLKHLKELRELVSQGNRCMMFYLIQRMDAEKFGPADHIDHAYGKELRNALKDGVEIAVYDVILNREYITLGKKIPHIL